MKKGVLGADANEMSGTERRDLGMGVSKQDLKKTLGASAVRGRWLGESRWGARKSAGRSFSRGGFTIIEVSLVVAIAGLIFLMVMIGVPAVQRTQRDSQRKENIAEMLTELKNFQTNNRGAVPTGTGTVNYDADASGTTWAGFYHDYLGENFRDPNGSQYVLRVVRCDNTNGTQCTTETGLTNIASGVFPNGYLIYVVVGAKCDGATAVGAENPRKVAATYKLEGGGVVCSNT